MNEWEKLKKLFATKKRISIVSHPSPDGDSIGSSLAMYWFLKEKGHDVKVITPDKAPEYLSFLQGFENINCYDEQKKESQDFLKSSEVILFLDFNRLNRLRRMGEFLEKHPTAYWINIDHHQDPLDFCDFQYCFPGSSSTAELIYQFIFDLNEESQISFKMAQAIYTGILTDTGSFRFSSTAASTHRTVASLIELGVEPQKIHQNIYDNFSKERLQLFGFALNQRLIFHEKYATAIIYLSEADLEKFNHQKGDTEGLVNFPLSMGSINFAILATQKDDKIKLSLRSKGSFPANKFAETHFQGGGHINAAGGISMLSMEETLSKIAQLLPDYENELQA